MVKNSISFRILERIKNKENTKQQRVKEFRKDLTNCEVCAQATKQKTSFWGLNDPRALCIHRKIGEMITVDNQPFSLVEDIGFIHLLHTLEPR